MAAQSAVPTVSVTMCVFNGAAYVGEAVESILAQSFADLELIVVDDGSTDETPKILASYTDSRMHWVSQAHAGIPVSRNHALSLARGPFIAVLDADDIAEPHRLARQVDYMTRHQEVAALGSAYRQVELMRDRTLDVVPPLTDVEIRRTLVTGNPICHSSVIMRRSALEKVGFYDEAFRYSQDYELWSRLAQVGELRNLPDLLVTRRYHQRSVSNDMSTELLRLGLFWRASNLAISRLGFPWPYRLLPLRSMGVFLVLDLFAAGTQWWQGLRITKEQSTQ